MGRSIACVLLLASASVQAQPGMTPTVPLTPDEQELLAHGEYSTGRITGGGITAIIAGYGIGQAVEGRWLSDGWKFTLFDVAGTALYVGGLASAFQANCDSGCNNGALAMFLGGFAILSASRIWQSFDAFVEPKRHNHRLRELRQRLGMPPPTLGPYVAPSANGGATTGLVLRF
jgi:hypothetical protein